VQIALLGPLEVRDDNGTPVAVSGARLRDLIARLALAGGRPVNTAALVDAVWADEPPADAANALQTLVSRARRAIGDPGAIEQSAAGYRLVIAPDDVDACRFEGLVVEGRTAEALGLWRGPALTDIGTFAEADARRLHELRLDATVTHLTGEIDAGRAASHVAELETLTADHPLHEKLAGLLMRALATTGRQADALHAYEALRARLADELGVDPGPELQAVHLEVLRGEVPPARSTPARGRTNLRAALTSFVGREDEVARITKALDQYRLVTLVGPGGAGKTRLASEVASGLDSAPDGIWLAELASVTDPGDVPQAVLGSLGLREVQVLERRLDAAPGSARDALGRLLDTLVDKRALLILDNCEHLIEACARLAETLLAQCPELRVLTTSREPLGLFGEALQAVPPLGQPEPGASPTAALDYPAVRLFADRAAVVLPDFELDTSTVEPVIDIVRRLDGLPLAIELAAARLRTMPLIEVAARLDDRFRLLTGGSRTALPRHRTLRAVVEWSWDLLTDTERLLAERLAVYPAGVTTQSAAAVCVDGRIDDLDLPDLLGSLIDKSLLQRTELNRLRMLETIREYGLERLGDRGELADVRRWHADYFAELVERAQPHVISREQVPWIALLSAERDNILAGLRFRCDAGDADGALAIATGLGGFAMLMGNDVDAVGWIVDALTVPGATDRELIAVAHGIFAMASFFGGPEVPGGGVPPEPVDLAETVRTLGEIDFGRRPLGVLLRAAVAYFAGDRELADRYLAAGIASDDPWLRAAMLMFSASLAENEGDLAVMRETLPIALDEFRTLGERWGLGGTLRSLGQLRMYDGDLAGARAAYEEALELMEEMGSREDQSFLFMRLGEIAMRQGDTDGARAELDRARASAEQTGSSFEAAVAATMLAQIERLAGRPELARQLQSAAVGRLTAIAPAHPAHVHARAMIEAGNALQQLADGDRGGAAAAGRQALTSALASRDMPIVANVAVVLAAISAEPAPSEAATILGIAAALRGSADDTSPQLRELRGRLVAALGAAAFEAAFRAGRDLDKVAALERLSSDQVRRW